MRLSKGLLLAAPAAWALMAPAAWAQTPNPDALAEAQAAVQRFAGPQTAWEGPTSSPAPQPGKHIVWIPYDQRNDASRTWGEEMKEAAAHLGWEVTIIDGQGSAVSQLAAFNQAIALHADGIATSADAAGLQEPIQEAVKQGIVVVGIHATALPGPAPDLGLFVNIQQDPRDIGKAEADWIIANSGDHCRAVVTTHGEFAIAFTKATATKDELEKAGCDVLEFNNSPIAEAQQRQPQLVATWVQQYGLPLYITAVADYTLDFQVPALRTGGVDPSQVVLVGADGQVSAYDRIRAGDQYQLVTVSEPYGEQAYQAIDEFNRAFNGQPPSGFVQAPYLVTPDNVDAEGGDKNTFVPSNNYAAEYLKIWGVQ